ncbi:hypothetical protein HJG60_009564 [Phyllostomus discolor]|uniref:Uncharacterized protein n=1 Tax=Phyllostomus discolor TaxID=89673 RepID=A0A833YC41_9CHIR|nr:hypothetical protein HJG60_009564 [Phyllostomus discolor]
MDVYIMENLNDPMPKSSVSLILGLLEHVHCSSSISSAVFLPHKGTQKRNPPVMICTSANHRDLAPRLPSALYVFIPHKGTPNGNPPVMICASANQHDLAPAQPSIVTSWNMRSYPSIKDEPCARNVLSTGAVSVELGGHDPQSWTPLHGIGTTLVNLDEYRSEIS